MDEWKQSQYCRNSRERTFECELCGSIHTYTHNNFNLYDLYVIDYYFNIELLKNRMNFIIIIIYTAVVYVQRFSLSIYSGGREVGVISVVHYTSAHTIR